MFPAKSIDHPLRGVDRPVAISPYRALPWTREVDNPHPLIGAWRLFDLVFYAPVFHGTAQVPYAHARKLKATAVIRFQAETGLIAQALAAISPAYWRPR
jgi:hypothetical protein